MLQKPVAIGLSDPVSLRKTESQLAQASIIAKGKQTAADSELIKPYTTVAATNNTVATTTSTTINTAGDTTTIYTVPGTVYVSSIDQTIKNITTSIGVTSITAGNNISVSSSTGDITITGVAGGISLDTVNVFTKNQSCSVITLESSAGVVAMDSSLSNNFRLWLTEDTTLLTPTNATDGMVINFQVRQGSAGNWILTFPANFSWPGGVVPNISTGANDYDFISMFYDGLPGVWRCVINQAFGVAV